MNHRTGLDRSQTLLFPERLEDYVAANNPVRFLDAFVGSQDLHALGFAKAQCAATGRPPYDPAALLKLYLYGYRAFLQATKRRSGPLWDFYQASLRQTKSPTHARLNTQRKILLVLWTLWLKGQDFDPNQFSRPQPIDV